MSGTVYLIGAGPGDAGLLTVRGAALLQQADCVIYDRLGTEQLLAQLPPHCEKIYVGKADSHHTLKQEEINRLLAEKAQQYPIVVRLKGGDPFVFGRGGEEGCYLHQQGVPFEVVSGVTSAVAGLAAAGIPITHRNMARGFRVYTAHDKNGGFGDLDFASMANTTDTLVFLMGLNRLQAIVQQLMEAGKSGATPAAVVSQATLPSQKAVTAPLCELEQAVQQAKLESPAIIVVGDVVSLSKQLGGFSQRPLQGKTVLFPQTGTDPRLPELLSRKGAQVETVQVSCLEPTETAWQSVCQGAGAQWVAFTSHNGVDYFFQAAAQNGQDARCLAGTMVAAIGKSTAQALQRHGIRADFVSPVSTAEGFADALSQEMLPGERLLLVCPEMELPACWAMESNPVIAAPVYRNVANPAAHSPALPPDAAVFTCASSVHRLAALLDQPLNEFLANSAVAAIGSKTAAALKQYGIQPAVCETSDYPSLVQTLCGLFESV